MSGRERWIGTARERKGGRYGKNPEIEREREKEAQAGHPHIAHSLLIWLSFPYSTFHDSHYFSEVGSTAAVNSNASDGRGGL